MKRKPIIYLQTMINLSLICVFVQCGNSNPNSFSETLSLLPPGQHLGYIEGFNPDNSPQLQKVMQECWSEAREHGMQTARVQMDWTDVEPTQGVIHLDEISSRLEFAYEQDMPVFLLLTSVDSDAFNFPSDLLSQDGETIADEMRPNDPKLVERYTQMLKEVLPIAHQYGVYCISVGNEPDTHHEQDPHFVADFIDFVGQVRDVSHTLEPDIAITYTSTVDPVLHPERGYSHLIAEAVDVMSFNFYGLGYDEGLDLERTTEVLQGILNLAGTKSVLLQELGCSSHLIADEFLSFYPSDQNLQRDFFEWVFQEIETHPQIRAAYIFQLVENSPIVDQFWRQALEGSGLPEEWITQFVQSLDGLGLITFETAEKKPAWNVFLDALQRFDPSNQNTIPNWKTLTPQGNDDFSD